MPDEQPEEQAPAPEVAAPEGTAEAAPATLTRRNRKVREGLVTSIGMQKTAVVSITERVRHPRYKKTVQQVKKLYAHDEDEQAKIGDRVRVMEIRPVSRTKRWRLLEIVERAR